MNKVAYATFRCKNRSSSGIEAIQKTQLWSAYRVGVASEAVSPKCGDFFLSARPSKQHAMHDGKCSVVTSKRTQNGGINSTVAPSGG